MCEKKIARQKNISIIVSAATIIVYLVWLVVFSTANKAGIIVAALSLALFTYILIKFICRVHEEWFDGEYIINAGSFEEKVDVSTYIKLFAAFLLIGIVELILIHLIRVYVFHDTTTFFEGLELFYHIDTGYYVDIAENWYVNSSDTKFNLVFYPGYPIVIRLFSLITGEYLIAGVISSMLLYSVNACLLFKLLIKDFSFDDAKRGLKYLAIIPGAFFFVSPMSESLFFFLSLLTIIFAREDRWMLSVVFGAFCAFTRSLGILIMVPLMYHCITMAINDIENRKIWIKRCILCLLISLGTLAYIYINYLVTGDFFAFSSLEKEKWNQSLGLFFNTIAFQIDNGLADIQTPYYVSALGIWLPNVAYSLFVLSVVAISSKTLSLEYAGWFICYFVIAIGVTYLISAPRYLVACLPVYPALVIATKNKKADTIITAGCIVCSLYYLFAFAARWEVF